jgi:hypothetical protein
VSTAGYSAPTRAALLRLGAARDALAQALYLAWCQVTSRRPSWRAMRPADREYYRTLAHLVLEFMAPPTRRKRNPAAPTAASWGRKRKLS